MVLFHAAAGITSFIPQSLQLQAPASLGTYMGGTRIRMRVGQRVSVVRAVDVPVLVCVRSSCSHVTVVGARKVYENRNECFHAK